MAKRKTTNQGSLFDVFDERPAPPKLQAASPREPDFLLHPECRPHGKWLKTETVWPGETFVRMTITCAECGEIRGRASA